MDYIIISWWHFHHCRSPSNTTCYIPLYPPTSTHFTCIIFFLRLITWPLPKSMLTSEVFYSYCFLCKIHDHTMESLISPIFLVIFLLCSELHFYSQEVCTLILAVETGDHMNLINVVGLCFCLGGITFHVLHKATIASRRCNTDEFSFNSEGDPKQSDDSSDLRVPLLAEPSVMFMSGNFNSTDESDEDSSNVLFNILQRRDNPRLHAQSWVALFCFFTISHLHS